MIASGRTEGFVVVRLTGDGERHSAPRRRHARGGRPVGRPAAPETRHAITAWSALPSAVPNAVGGDSGPLRAVVLIAITIAMSGRRRRRPSRTRAHAGRRASSSVARSFERFVHVDTVKRPRPASARRSASPTARWRSARTAAISRRDQDPESSRPRSARSSAAERSPRMSCSSGAGSPGGRRP